MKIKDLTYKLLLILIFVFPLIPKSLDMIPIRVLLIFIFNVVGIYDILKNKKEVRKIKKGYIYLYILFLLTTSFSLIKTTSIITTLYTIFKFLLYFIFFVILYINKFTKDQYKMFLKVFLFTSLIVMIYGVITYIFTFNLNYTGVGKYEGIIGRVMSTMTNPIYHGLFCVFVFIIGYMVLLQTKKLKIKYYLLINTLIILTILNLELTYARSAYLLFLGSIFIIMLINIKKIPELLKKSIFIILTIIITFSMFLQVRSAFKSAVIEVIPTSLLKKNGMYNNSMVQNVEETNNKNISYGEEVDYSIVTRNQFKTISKKVIKDNYLFGVGFGAYKNYFDVKKNYDKYIVDRFGYPHDNYMHILAETGIFGFGMFIIILIMIMYLIIKHYYYYGANKIILYNGLIYTVVILIMFYESFFYDSLITPIYLAILAISLNYVRDNSKQLEDDIN